MKYHYLVGTLFYHCLLKKHVTPFQGDGAGITSVVCVSAAPGVMGSGFPRWYHKTNEQVMIVKWYH